MAELFRKSALPPDVRLTDIGLHPGRPFQILGLLEAQDYGDLIANVVFLSSLAHQFDHVRLHVKFRDIRPWSRAIMSLSPWIDLAEPLPGEWPRLLRWLLPSGRPLKPLRRLEVNSQKGKHVYLYDMIVTSPMAARDIVHALPVIVPLRVPEAQVDALRSRLIARGLKPDRWFASLHAGPSSDAAAFDGLVDHVIALGGQAVRLGPGDRASFRPRDGFIDLSREHDDLLLQAAAISHSRFTIAGPSDFSALAMALAVPLTVVDATTARGIWHLDRTDMLTLEVTTPGGEVLRNAALAEEGFPVAAAGARIRSANADELAIVARKLHDRTKDCGAWRAPAKIPDGPKTNEILWPPEPTWPTVWCNI